MHLCIHSFLKHTHNTTHIYTHKHTQAQSAGNRGELDSARTNQKISIGCTVGAIVVEVLGVIIIIVAAVLGWWFTVGVLINSFNNQFNNQFAG